MDQCLRSVTFTRIQRFKHQMKRHCLRVQLGDTVKLTKAHDQQKCWSCALPYICSAVCLTAWGANVNPLIWQKTICQETRTKLMWKRKQENESTTGATYPLRSFGVQSISHLNEKHQSILPGPSNLNNILHLPGKSWLSQSGSPQPPISCRLLENHYLGHL